MGWQCSGCGKLFDFVSYHEQPGIRRIPMASSPWSMSAVLLAKFDKHTVPYTGTRPECFELILPSYNEGRSGISKLMEAQKAFKREAELAKISASESNAKRTESLPADTNDQN